MTNNFFEDYKQNISSVFSMPTEGCDKEQEVVRNMEIRQDPIFLSHSTALSPERANRPMKQSEEKKYDNDPNKCIFCLPQIYEKTPTPRKEHSKLISFSNPNEKTISVPNLYPFSYPHWVTVFPVHKPDLRYLDYEDLVNYFESGYEIATEIKKLNGIVGMWDIINWGKAAGASQEHPHAQRGGICEKMITDSDTEMQAYTESKLRLRNEDPFEEYMDAIRNSNLYGWENDYLFIYAPFAPKMSDEVQMILKPKEIRNILDLDEDSRKNISKCMLGVFHVLREKRGVTDLNVIMHQQRFDQKDNYRINWHIIPRNKSLWGGMEMNNHYVVDVYPETTAQEIRNHYNTWWWKEK